MVKFTNRKLTNPLDFHPNELRRERAERRGLLDKYLRSEANNYISRAAVREYVFTFYNHTCNYCGVKEDLQMDHIVSVFRGGENAVSNLQVLCRSCNSWKGS